jgi:hypothetical protein
MWPSDLRRAIAASCAPHRNWRWMLSSLGIGAGFGLIAGLERLGQEPASITLDVAASTARGATAFLVVAWLVAVAIRFVRFLRTARK